jgi:hypothetical protein
MTSNMRRKVQVRISYLSGRQSASHLFLTQDCIGRLSVAGRCVQRSIRRSRQIDLHLRVLLDAGLQGHQTNLVQKPKIRAAVRVRIDRIC